MVRVKRVVIAAVFGGVAGLLIGMLIHHRGWIAVASLVVVAGVSALISRLGSTGSVTGLQLLVFAALGLGSFGALRPWWHVALGFLAGVAWALLLLVPGWLLSPRSAEQSAVTHVYHALADDLRAIGTDRTAGARRAVTAALNTAYDTLLTAQAAAGGRSRRMTHLMAVLNASSRVSDAVITLRHEGTRPPPLVAGPSTGSPTRSRRRVTSAGRQAATRRPGRDAGTGGGPDAGGPRTAGRAEPGAPERRAADPAAVVVQPGLSRAAEWTGGPRAHYRVDARHAARAGAEGTAAPACPGRARHPARPASGRTARLDLHHPADGVYRRGRRGEPGVLPTR